VIRVSTKAKIVCKLIISLNAALKETVDEKDNSTKHAKAATKTEKKQATEIAK
jgi:hypothetical protein